MIDTIQKWLAKIAFKLFKHRLRKLANCYFYENRSPSPQNAIELFQGMWSSKFPNDIQVETQATAKAFEDKRIIWAIEQLGDLNGKVGLELGPLEAGHSYMLQATGIKSLTSIESNSNSFLKCLIAKEVLGLNKVKFLFGDFVRYLKETSRNYDFIIASGVLYHLEKPVEFIESILEKGNRIYVWTHYYSKNLTSRFPQKFSKQKKVTYNKNTYLTSRYLYNNSLDWDGFCGGPNSYSTWLEKELIIKIFEDNGFKVEIHFDDIKHVHGPCISFFAFKN